MHDGVDVYFIFWFRERFVHHRWARFEEIWPSGQHLILVHPDDRAFELIGDFGWRSSGYNNIPARAVDFVRQSQGHGLSRHCLWQVPVESDDGFDRAGLA